jgi:hypothetical protein
LWRGFSSPLSLILLFGAVQSCDEHWRHSWSCNKFKV